MARDSAFFLPIASNIPATLTMGITSVRGLCQYRITTDKLISSLSLPTNTDWFLKRSHYKPLLNRLLTPNQLKQLRVDGTRHIESGDELMIRDGDSDICFTGLTQNVDYFIIQTKNGLGRYGTVMKNLVKTIKSSFSSSRVSLQIPDSLNIGEAKSVAGEWKCNWLPDVPLTVVDSHPLLTWFWIRVNMLIQAFIQHKSDFITELFGMCMPTMLQLEKLYMDWDACEKVIVDDLATITKVPRSQLVSEQCHLVYYQNMKHKRVDLADTNCADIVSEERIGKFLSKYYKNKKHATDIARRICKKPSHYKRSMKVLKVMTSACDEEQITPIEVWSVIGALHYMIRNTFPYDTKLERSKEFMACLQIPSLDTLPDYTKILINNDKDHPAHALLSCGTPQHCTIRPVHEQVVKTYNENHEMRSWIDTMIVCTLCNLYKDKNTMKKIDQNTIDCMIRLYDSFIGLSSKKKHEFVKKISNNKQLFQCIVQQYLVYCYTRPVNVNIFADIVTTETRNRSRGKKPRHSGIIESSECNASIVRSFFRTNYKTIYTDNAKQIDKVWNIYLKSRNWSLTEIKRKYTSLLTCIDTCILNSFKDIYGDRISVPSNPKAPVEYIWLPPDIEHELNIYFKSFEMAAFIDVLPGHIWIEGCLSRCGMSERDKKICYRILDSYYIERDSNAKTEEIVKSLTAKGFCILLHFISKAKLHNSMNCIKTGIESALKDAMAVHANNTTPFVAYTTNCCSRICNSLNKEKCGMIETFTTDYDDRRHCRHKTTFTRFDRKHQYLYFEMFLLHRLHGKGIRMQPPVELLDAIGTPVATWVNLYNTYIKEDNKLEKLLLPESNQDDLVEFKVNTRVDSKPVGHMMNTMDFNSIWGHKSKQKRATKEGIDRMKRLMNKQAKRLFVMFAKNMLHTDGDLVSEENAIGKLMIFRGTKNKKVSLLRICHKCGSMRTCNNKSARFVGAEFTCKYCIQPLEKTNPVGLKTDYSRQTWCRLYCA
jgi:hypothetical protein